MTEIALAWPHLSTARQQVVAAAVQAAQQLSQGLSAEAAGVRSADSDLRLRTGFVLGQRLAQFEQAFSQALAHTGGDPAAAARPNLDDTDWQALSLMDDDAVEAQMGVARIAQQIAHRCEWELRDLSALTSALTPLPPLDQHSDLHNPLRAERVGAALFDAVQALGLDNDAQQLLLRELGSALAEALRSTYRQIVETLQAEGVRPRSFSLRPPAVRPHGASTPTAAAGLASASASAGQTVSASGAQAHAGASVGATLSGAGPAGPSGTAPAATEDSLMALLRRLSQWQPPAFSADPGALPQPTPADIPGGGHGPAQAEGATAAPMPAGATPDAFADKGLAQAAHNLIRLHRHSLQQASSGPRDPVVIDLVGNLFDQVLADPQVPPQLARQLARLQLPVLRAALKDHGFFSSAQHPVRRFVDGMASLACAFTEFDSGPGRQFLDQVEALVQEVVEGDFDQLQQYSRKLAALERFGADQAQGGLPDPASAQQLLENKEKLRRQQWQFRQQLQSGLAAMGTPHTPVTLPDYLQDFLAQVWSQAISQAAADTGPSAPRASHFREVARDLALSVQPQGAAQLRQRFLQRLPGLMQDLHNGLAYIGWPEDAQKAFFAQLLPSHSESLKTPPRNALDHKLLARQLERLFAGDSGTPGAETGASVTLPGPLADGPQAWSPQFSEDEARQLGLVDDQAVDWQQPVDIDLSAPDTTPAAQADTAASSQADTGHHPPAMPPPLDQDVDIQLELATPPAPALVGTTGAAGTTGTNGTNSTNSPTGTSTAASGNTGAPDSPPQGLALMGHLKPGFAYRMLLQDRWQTVRLGHVSSGRGFYVFTHGDQQQQSLSMTGRMLARLCEAGRLRAVESSYLMERAMARARRQLAELKRSGRPD